MKVATLLSSVRQVVVTRPFCSDCLSYVHVASGRVSSDRTRTKLRTDTIFFLTRNRLLKDFFFGLPGLPGLARTGMPGLPAETGLPGARGCPVPGPVCPGSPSKLRAPLPGPEIPGKKKSGHSGLPGRSGPLWKILADHQIGNLIYQPRVCASLACWTPCKTCVRSILDLHVGTSKHDAS